MAGGKTHAGVNTEVTPIIMGNVNETHLCNEALLGVARSGFGVFPTRSFWGKFNDYYTLHLIFPQNYTFCNFYPISFYKQKMNVRYKAMLIHKIYRKVSNFLSVCLPIYM